MAFLSSGPYKASPFLLFVAGQNLSRQYSLPLPWPPAVDSTQRQKSPQLPPFCFQAYKPLSGGTHSLVNAAAVEAVNCISPSRIPCPHHTVDPQPTTEQVEDRNDYAVCLPA